MLIFWSKNPALTGVLLFLVIAPYVTFVLMALFWGTLHSKEWYDRAQKIALEKRHPEGKMVTSKGNLLRFARYIIYPRPQDAMKILFIVAGCAVGFLIAGDAVFSTDELLKFAGDTVFVVVVLDVLGYQARYQLNDIRGAKEDQENPRADARRRLHEVCGSLRAAKSISALFAMYKLIFATALSFVAGNGMGIPLVVSLALTILLAVAYETARGRSWPFWIIYSLVCLAIRCASLRGLRVSARFRVFLPPAILLFRLRASC